MHQDATDVQPHPSEPGLLQLAPHVLDKLLCDDPITDHLTVEQQVFARGKYATVRRTHRTVPHGAGGLRQEWYAAKYQRKQRRGTSVRHAILHEAAVLYLLRQEGHVVQLRGLYETPSEMILLLQLAPHGEVQRLVDEAADGVGEWVAQVCLRHTLHALTAMHTRNLAHLDLKPQNLLLMAPPGPSCCVKLCDFGVARELRTHVELREVVGTPDYVAPEVLQYEPISLATDMWSVGVLAYVLLSGHSPFAGDTKQETFLNITQGEVDFPEDLFEGVSSSARDFIQALIQLNPQSRLTVEEALTHPWLNGFSSLPPTVPVGDHPPTLRPQEGDSPPAGEEAPPPNGEVPSPAREIPSPKEEEPPDGGRDPPAGEAPVSSDGGKSRNQREVEKNPSETEGSRGRDRGGSTDSPPRGVQPPPRPLNVSTEVTMTNDAIDKTSPDGDPGSTPMCTSTATISLRCKEPPAGVQSTVESRPSLQQGLVPVQAQSGLMKTRASSSNLGNSSKSDSSSSTKGTPPPQTPTGKPRLPPKPNNLSPPGGAVSPKKLGVNKPPVARKPVISDPRAPPVPSGGLARPERGPGPTPHLRRQKSGSPSSGSPRGSPQPSGGMSQGSPRLGRSSRGNSPQTSPRLSRSSRGSPETCRTRESLRASSSRSPQLSRGLRTRPKEASPHSPQPSAGASGPAAPKSSPQISRKVRPSSPARGLSTSSPSPSRRPFSSPSSRMSESPPSLRRSWPPAGDARSEGAGRLSRCRHDPHSENNDNFSPSPTRHLSRRLQESPSRNCCRPRLEPSGGTTLRATSPSPPRPTVATRSPRAARSSFARNVEALHKGAPTNQPLRGGCVVNATSSPNSKSLDAPDGGVGGTRKTPSHSPPMFQPAPKKSNTVSQFLTTTCGLRSRSGYERSDGEPISGIADPTHAPSSRPVSAIKSNKHSPRNKNESIRDRIPLRSPDANSAKSNQSLDVRGAKPVPKPRPAHLSIKSEGVDRTLQCPPVSSCFAVFSSSSLSSPENSAQHSFSSSHSSGSLPSRQCLSPCSTSSSCSDFSFSKPWPDNSVIPGTLKLERGKENDRNILNSPTESQKNVSWHPAAAGDERAPHAVTAMEVDGDNNGFSTAAVMLMRHDEEGSISHC